MDIHKAAIIYKTAISTEMSVADISVVKASFNSIALKPYFDLEKASSEINEALELIGGTIYQLWLAPTTGQERFLINIVNPINAFNFLGDFSNVAVDIQWKQNLDESYSVIPRLLIKKGWQPTPPKSKRRKPKPIGPFTRMPYEKD